MKSLLKSLALAFGAACALGVAAAATIPALPYTLVNGTPTDANKVMANYNLLWSYLDGLYTPVVTPGTYGDANNNIQVTVNSRGQITTIQNKSISAHDCGDVKAYAGSSAPSGWLLSYGQAISRTTYSCLFAAIGTTYGNGDGSTTFNLPDLRGRSIVGKDNMGGSGAGRVTSAGSNFDAATLGATGGNQAMQSHSHSITDPGHLHRTTSNNAYVSGNALILQSALSPGADDGSGDWNTSPVMTGITGTNTTGSGNSQNMQPGIALNFVIYTGV